MGIALPQHKINQLAKQSSFAQGRQPVRFGLRKIDNQHDFGLLQRGCGQDAHAPRLDQPAQGWGAAGDHTGAVQGQFGLIIGHQFGPKCHKIQA